MLTRRHMSRLTRWLRERGDFEAPCEQGASALLCPVAHHALRHSAIDMPNTLVTSARLQAIWTGLVSGAGESRQPQAGHDQPARVLRVLRLTGLSSDKRRC